jgi:hypothetical protein
MCIFSAIGFMFSWLYCTSSVGVCVDPVGVGQVYAGGVYGNVHVKLASLRVSTLPGIRVHSRQKIAVASWPALKGKNAVHPPKVRVAVWPPKVEGLHGVAVGGVDVTVVLPSGQVTVTAQAELLILFVFSAVALELELLSAEVILIFSVFVMVHHVSVERYIKC